VNALSRAENASGVARLQTLRCSPTRHWPVAPTVGAFRDVCVALATDRVCCCEHVASRAVAQESLATTSPFSKKQKKKNGHFLFKRSVAADPSLSKQKKMAYESNKFSHTTFGKPASLRANAAAPSLSAANNNSNPNNTSSLMVAARPAVPPLPSLPTVILNNRHQFAPPAGTAAAAAALHHQASIFASTAAALKEKQPVFNPLHFFLFFLFRA